jgi:hypothetical protein
MDPLQLEGREHVQLAATPPRPARTLHSSPPASTSPIHCDSETQGAFTPALAPAPAPVDASWEKEQHAQKGHANGACEPAIKSSANSWKTSLFTTGGVHRSAAWQRLPACLAAMRRALSDLPCAVVELYAG